MSDNAPESSIVIDEVTVRTFAPRGPRTNLDGKELEAPKLVISFIGDLDRFIPHMNRITRVYRKSRAVRITLDFVEQLEMPKVGPEEPASERPRLSDPLGTFPKNGRGKKGDLEQTEPIPHVASSVDEFLDDMGARGEKGKERARKKKEGAKA